MLNALADGELDAATALALETAASTSDARLEAEYERIRPPRLRCSEAAGRCSARLSPADEASPRSPPAEQPAVGPRRPRRRRKAGVRLRAA